MIKQGTGSQIGKNAEQFDAVSMLLKQSKLVSMSAGEMLSIISHHNGIYQTLEETLMSLCKIKYSEDSAGCLLKATVAVL